MLFLVMLTIIVILTIALSVTLLRANLSPIPLKSNRVSKDQWPDNKFVDNILDSLNYPIMVVNEDGMIIRANKQTFGSFGLSQNDASQFRIFNAIKLREGNGYKTINEMRDALTAGKSISAEMLIKNSDGSETPTLMSAVHLTSEENGNQTVISLRDISDIIKAQDEKTQMYKKIMLASRMGSLGTLGAGIAHELNNPLVGVRGYAEIIESDPKSSDSNRQFSRKILDATERMRKIIDHLRSFTADSRSRERTSVDINHLIADALSLFSTQFAAKDIIIETSYDQGHCLITADHNQIAVLFHNLLANSFDAFHEAKNDRKKIIKIQTKYLQSGTVQITLSDNASGMSQDVLRRVFEPFFTTKDVNKGSGLGLSIVHSIVQDHSGHIHTESDLGLGTTFYLSFPSMLPRVRDFSAKDVQPLLNQRTGKPRCILIDDDKMVADVLSLYIESIFDITVSTDSTLAVESFDTENYDLVITDMKMPGLSGLDVIKYSKEKLPSAKIVVISGHAKHHADSELAMSLGASFIIPKPFPKMEDVIEKLSELMNLKEKKHRVLIIDDEPELLEVLESFLSNYFVVTSANDAKSARDHIQSGKFDLVITDMSLPESNGLEMFDLTKKHLPEAKVIIISGLAENDQACLEVRNRGAADIISKPFECGSGLIERIEKALELN